MYTSLMTLASRKNSAASTISDSSQLENPSVLSDSQVRIGSVLIPVEVVSTTEAINKGLAHRRSLKASDGMLFLFDHNAQFKFWMRGMRFPIDIIWIDENYSIADIIPHLPTVGLFGKATFYSPTVAVRYVLEVNAGFCDQHHIQVGDVAEFISIQV